MVKQKTQDQLNQLVDKNSANIVFAKKELDICNSWPSLHRTIVLNLKS